MKIDHKKRQAINKQAYPVVKIAIVTLYLLALLQHFNYLEPRSIQWWLTIGMMLLFIKKL